MRTLAVYDTSRNASSLPPELKSSTPLSHCLNCGKMLHGRAKILKIGTSKSVICKYNYAKLKTARDGLAPRTMIREFLGDDIKYNDALKLVSEIRKINTSFYKHLESELAHCLFAKGTGDHLRSFLHMYRSIEKLAAAFPLIYISGQSDFVKSIDDLREYFRDKGGELSFARKFSDMIAKETWGRGAYDIDFKTKLSDLGLFSVLISEISRCCPDFVDADIDPNDGKFSISFEKVPSFIVACRNRMFHFSNDGQKNFDLDRIAGPDELCRMLVDSGLHWITLCFDEVFRKQASRLVLIDT